MKLDKTKEIKADWKLVSGPGPELPTPPPDPAAPECPVCHGPVRFAEIGGDDYIFCLKDPYHTLLAGLVDLTMNTVLKSRRPRRKRRRRVFL